jgi:hypothetical protein
LWARTTSNGLKRTIATRSILKLLCGQRYLKPYRDLIGSEVFTPKCRLVDGTAKEMVLPNGTVPKHSGKIDIVVLWTGIGVKIYERFRRTARKAVLSRSGFRIGSSYGAISSGSRVE